ncbi:MAG TPA: alpha/beta hydrolase [Pyrinomonadaceae bacterium]|nr:alpha/beta hydrolase [Pyrinomonadaceae bacterium]
MKQPMWQLSRFRPMTKAMELVVFLILVTGCSTAVRYTSLDLDLLPCEQGNAPVFFKAIEFDKSGSQLFPKQLQELKNEFRDKEIKDLVVFVHGWNKNPSSAEQDYQNFLCRLHGRLRMMSGGPNKERSELLVLGVFWPSTITNRDQEPFLLLPASYYQIRDRAEEIGALGLAPVLTDLIPYIQRHSTRLHLIGHSFGGRILVRALRKMQTTDQLIPFIEASDELNVVLANAAMSADNFNWILADVTREKRKGDRPSRFGGMSSSYLFNVHSLNDTANRILFRLASAFNDDPAECAAGACGVPDFPTVCLSESGDFKLEQAPPEVKSDLHAWNIDATKIVFDHSDIYKGRVATLIANLLYDEAVRARFLSSRPAPC